MMRALMCALLFWVLPASAANYTDIWWNKTESGWGMTLAHQNNKIFGVWYVYGSDSKPLWVVMPDGAFSNGNRTFTGALYTTTGPGINNVVFDAAAVKATAVGKARIDFSADGSGATVVYDVNGITSTKQVTRQPYGSSPADNPDDTSDLWFSPSESGWGLAITQHGDTVFAVWYTYGEDGKPLWIVMPDGRFSQPGRFAGKLYTTNGGTPLGGAFDPASVQVQEVGAATVTIEGNEGRFTGTVKGYAIDKRITRQLFGALPPANKKPTVQLQLVPMATPLKAPGSVRLRASAADGDNGIVKVEFYESCVKIGEKTAAPYEWVANNLTEGKHTFSALAVDGRGATKLASASIEVLSSTGTPPSGNKPPTVSISAPAAGGTYLVGATVALTAKASDPDGTVARLQFFVGPTMVADLAASPWTASWVAVTGDYDITAVATDDKGLSTTSSPVSIAVAGPGVMYDAATKDAARFLTQATFGPKGIADIAALKARGYTSWLNEQFAAQANSHVAYVNARVAAGEKAYEERAYEAIWQQWLFEPGQLRARMSFALSEIFVISNIAPDLDTMAMASYMDMLNRNAFGNYRQLLEDVALHPAMGYYLNMIGSKKANPAKGTHPNENFAREVMQLFSIGLYKLNPDGTRVIVNGLPVPTYDQSVVGAMAAAFTGWSFAGNDTNNAELFDPAKENWVLPLIPWEVHHDRDAKTIFDGITLPPGQTARADMKLALDAIFNHPNVGPFFGRQLIQRFVTSNPSPAYIGRVAAAFANNGQGVRGDLTAVMRAVLLDPEARDLTKATEGSWGKQREPVVRFANFLRGFNATSPSGRNKIWYLDSADEGLNQSPLLSPSVFNFFSPNYRQPGPLAAANLVAPEFQITTETSMVGGLNFFARLARNGFYGNDDTRLTLNLTELNALAARPADLADRLNLLLFAGGMSQSLRNTIVSTLASLPMPKTGGTVTDRVKAALVLVAMSPEYVIQK